MAEDGAGVSRTERRKARTRSALVAAAAELLAEGASTDAVSIREITDRADVGFGTFYNYFDAKTDLFAAAAAEALDEQADRLVDRTAHLDDPAEVFATRLRLLVGLVDTHPQVARILLRSGSDHLLRTSGHAPRALHDLTAAARAGRLTVDDPAAALAATGGAVLGVVQLLVADAGRDVAATATGLAAGLLRMFGLGDAEAAEVASRPLPTEVRR
ncbi:TetR/AcrR family transcriptional regulator [Rhodococcus aerolatus]